MQGGAAGGAHSGRRGKPNRRGQDPSQRSAWLPDQRAAQTARQAGGARRAEESVALAAPVEGQQRGALRAGRESDGPAEGPSPPRGCEPGRPVNGRPELLAGSAFQKMVTAMTNIPQTAGWPGKRARRLSIISSGSFSPGKMKLFCFLTRQSWRNHEEPRPL